MKRTRIAPVARASVAVAALVLAFVAPPLGAQAAGDGFLFQRPLGTLTVFGGFAKPNAGSDVFEFSTKNLTLSRNDFSAISVGFEVQMPLSPQFEVALGLSYAGSGKKSEFREWEDNNHLPIEQKTSLQRMPVTASLKYYLVPRGHSISRHVWVPSKYSPFIGAGAGVMWYNFRQEGDFIDFTTTNVFPDDFKSEGWTTTQHVLAGFDYSLSPRYSLTTEARYNWAKGGLNGDFSGFKNIDLSGFSTTIGVSVRF